MELFQRLAGWPSVLLAASLAAYLGAFALQRTGRVTEKAELALDAVMCATATLLAAMHAWAAWGVRDTNVAGATMFIALCCAALAVAPAAEMWARCVHKELWK